MKLTSFVLIFALFLAVGSAVRLTTKQMQDGTNVTISMPTYDLIKFEISTKDFGVRGYGFGKSMENLDLFLIEDDGTDVMITDMSTNSVGKLSPDTSNDYTLRTSIVGDLRIYTVTRKPDTHDFEDERIYEGENPMLYFYSKESPTSLSEMSQETFTLTVEQVDRRMLASGGSSTSHKALMHGLFCYIAWDWFSFLLIITGRYSKYFYSFRIYLHALIGVLACVFNIIGVAYAGIGYTNSQNSLGDAHTGLAGIVTAWACVMAGIGLVTKIAGRFLKHNSWICIWLRVIHIIPSYFLIIYAQFCLLSGLYYYDSPITYLFYVHVAIMIALLVLFEVLFCFFSQWKYSYIEKLHRKNVPDMSIEAFLQSEKKLALFDNYVIDMGGYYMDHPGGAYVLDECVKMDVGKYFFGSYSMENWVNPHTHTYIAGMAMLKMVVAKLVQPEANFKAFAPKLADSRDDLPSKSVLYESSMVFTVPSKVELIPMVYSVRFGNRKTQVKMFFEGTKMLGRHYVINSLQNQVCRYYTICNAMHTKVHRQYLSAFNAILDGGSVERDYKSIQDINNAWDDYLELVLKLYPQSKKGITKQLLQDRETDQFFISGPLSRGYDLSSENMAGQNVLFVGGTGVLPFIDLFAYLVRKVIAEKDNSHSVFPGEQFDKELDEAKFVVYGYYPREKDAVAIEFCTKISAVFEKLGCGDRFKFVPVYTRDGGKRLTKEELFNILGKHKDESGIKNLWVCSTTNEQHVPTV